MRRTHYAWVILAVSFTAIAATLGSRTAFGAFVRPWEQEFGVSRSLVASIGMLSFLFYGVGQPLVGRLLDIWEPRRVLAGGVLLTGLAYIGTYFALQVWHVHLLWGAMGAVGVAAGSSVTATVLVARWFHARRGLALGIMITGLSVGQAMMVPLSILGIANLGWRPTILLLGGLLALVLAPLTFWLIRSRPEDRGMLPYGATGATAAGDPRRTASWGGLGATLRSRQFWFLAIPYFVCGITTAGLIDTHLIPYAADHHLPEAAAASAVSLMAMLNMVGTLGSGWLSDRVSRKNLLALIYGVRALTILFLVTVRDPVSLMIFSAAFGLADFSTIAPTTALTADYFGGRSLGLVYGLVSLSHQLGAATGAYVPGLLHDATGSYALAFVGAAATLGVASLLSYLLPDSRAQAPLPAIAAAD